MNPLKKKKNYVILVQTDKKENSSTAEIQSDARTDTDRNTTEYIDRENNGKKERKKSHTEKTVSHTCRDVEDDSGQRKDSVTNK